MSRETAACGEQGQHHGEMLDLLRASQPTQQPTQHILPRVSRLRQTRCLRPIHTSRRDRAQMDF